MRAIVSRALEAIAEDEELPLPSRLLVRLVTRSSLDEAEIGDVLASAIEVRRGHASPEELETVSLRALRRAAARRGLPPRRQS